ncbi:MAG TPA: hypothetical protein VHI13_17850 [Candidatus Kapabacteria bacterium]|nr:hypothetical protein [Candidatus Kapabacteria bacterium]
MRYLATVFLIICLAACSTVPVARRGTQSTSPSQAVAPAQERGALDSVKEFLLAASATDFHDHRPPDPVRFRDVRMGRVVAPDGSEQYMLCGQFLPAEGGSRAEWMHFATIKTSGYEQWIGAQAAGFCQSPSVVWEQGGDLSSSLQSRLDSMR